MIRRQTGIVSTSHDFVLEEVGDNMDQRLEVTVEYDVSPSEPMVRYDANGSGHPGCDGYIDFTSYTVTKYQGDNGHELLRDGNAEFFSALDTIAEEIIESDIDRFKEGISEELADREVDCR